MCYSFIIYGFVSNLYIIIKYKLQIQIKLKNVHDIHSVTDIYVYKHNHTYINIIIHVNL